MILHFASALTAFQTDVHEGNANVRVVSRSSTGGGGGGGAISGAELAALAALLLIAGRRPAA
jgi:hypothetical protein